MAPVERKYYDLLGVSPEATPDELTSAYKKTALKLHPDKGGNPEQFKAMKAAYDVLKKPDQRQMYDSYGAGIVKAMNGEVVEPEVMLEVVMLASKTASKMLLCLLPFIAVLVLFPAVAFSLKWDGTVAWNWNIVFIPVWLVQVVALLLILKFRSVLSAPVDIDVDGGEDAAETEARKQKFKQVLGVGACIMILLIVQEVMLAQKLQGHIGGSWFVMLVPYLILELLYLIMRIYPLLDNMSGLVPTLFPVLWWGILRLCTVALLAAKAEQRIACSWTLCLLPVMIGGGMKVLWAARQPPPIPVEGEPPAGNGACGVCVTIAVMLSVPILGAGKLDGSTYSAFLVFLPFFLISVSVLCCCTCLACCGPSMLQAAVKEQATTGQQNEQAAQEATPEAGRQSEAQSLNAAPNNSPSADYKTMLLQQEASLV